MRGFRKKTFPKNAFTPSHNQMKALKCEGVKALFAKSIFRMSNVQHGF